MENQKILSPENHFIQLDAYLKEKGIRHIFLVCGKTVGKLEIGRYFDLLPERLGIRVTRFSGYQANPLYEDAVAGMKAFRESGADMIAAVGGGSCIDTAKLIKAYSTMPDDTEYIQQKITENGIPFFAVPTTSGTGAETTRFAVFYYEGRKHSSADPSLIPDVILMDPAVLKTVPEYQRKATMLDALCHALEAFLSTDSTPECKKIAAEAIGDLLKYQDPYLANEEDGNQAMLWASFKAGRAINIARTIAGHALCYKLTTLYGLAHGHATGLVNTKLFPYIISHVDSCQDPRGKEYLTQTLEELGQAFGCASAKAAASKLQTLYDKLDLPDPVREEDIPALCAAVDVNRLGNTPIRLTQQSIEEIFRQML